MNEAKQKKSGHIGLLMTQLLDQTAGYCIIVGFTSSLCDIERVSMKGILLEFGPLLIDGFVQDPLAPLEQKQLPIQVSAHTVTSRAFLNEMIEIFPHIEWNSLKQVVVLCTMQHAIMELVKMGTDVENEKDRLLENFVIFAKDICQKLSGLGYFADYFDPCSGLPALYTDSNKVFSEVFCAQTLLGYSIMNAGCCKILLHPEWGSAVYPASIVTTAPADIVNGVLAGFEKHKININLK